ncbi:protein strawberry notch homolog 1 [Patella vulgata]|uniref:protein strawberry notch homolog 1 n=1 Tax=Patella vulgata TaxID=6465 RepID=UPI00217F39A4|nr:protein strawberry notch homolog 1 [Patella vulgata]
METEANNSDFDLLSAALDVSGITGNDLEDFSLDLSSHSQPSSGYNSLPNSAFEDSSVVNGGHTDTEVNQADLFSQSLRQLSQSSQYKTIQISGSPNPLQAFPRLKPQETSSLLNTRYSQSISHVNSPVTPTSKPGPKIIRIPSSSLLNTGTSGQSPIVTRISHGGTSTQPRVITITRVAPSGNVGPGQKITLTPQTSTSSPKIIVASSGKTVGSLINNRQVLRTSSPIHVVNQTNLSGGKVITSSMTNSALDQARNTNSPISNIPTIVSQFGSGISGLNGNNIKTNITNKDLSRLWSNENVKVSPVGIQVQRIERAPSPFEEEEAEEEAQELGHAETYFEYMPSKLKIGEKHPDPVVETSSLSSVEPVDVRYKIIIPESTIDMCQLSALQLESITYASQRHNTILPSGERAGFLIGDGAGVGKGRTIAGTIFENYLQGRKRAIWLSVSNDLKVDAERDLRDIGAGKIEVYSLNKLRYAKISGKENGSIKKGVIFTTYSSLIGESQSGGKYRTRLKQLLKWCGKDFDGLIVFDECHKAKNLCPVGSSKPTKTGKTVLELQNHLPGARVVYASATGASEPKNMAYMTRLGLWGPGTPFREFNDFIQAVEKRGVGAMELVAMDMKLRGMYIARQLSFKGVSFKIEEVPLERDFKKSYNEAVDLWVEARDKFQKAADLIDAEHRLRKSMWGQFWSAHQRFFKYLCISAKVNYCVHVSREAVKNGKCVVIGLQSTGEARTLEQLEEQGGELSDFVSTAKGVFQTLVEKHFPAPDRRKTFDMFGIGNLVRNNEESIFNRNNNKRKKDMNGGNEAKRMKGEDSDSGDTSSEDSSDDTELNISESSSEESDGISDNFNPFGNGSDSDDDPWLKKSQNKKKEKSPKKKVKVKKKKSKKKEEEEEDEDSLFDKALAKAGLLNKNNDIFPSNNLNLSNGNTSVWEQAMTMKSDLLRRMEEIGSHLPPNTLDQLIDDLGGTEAVAEMTGRKGRVVSNDDGSISYESRSETDVPLEILNLTEKQRFMDGEKDIAIISEAASSGISLQADKRAINQKRRVHITLELPWSADRAIQQFGRTHRSNQVHAPEYIFLISELAGERRFAATVAKRLESLGALTHGDRRATESRDLSRFNIDNKYGRAALDAVMKSVLNLNGENPLVPPPKDYSGNFFADVKTGLIGVGMMTIDERSGYVNLEKDYNNISKFLNRILGMTVELQNSLFKYFTETLTAIILEAKRNGRWDMGILDLGSGQEKVRRVETQAFLGNEANNTAKTELTTFMVERGMPWLQAMELWRKCNSTEEGFYLANMERNSKKTAVLAVCCGKNKKKEKLYNMYRPNTGLQPRSETMDEIRKKYKKVLPDQTQQWWEDQYFFSARYCIHAYWRGNCKKVSLGLPCEIGLRTRTYHVLSGSVLSVWSKVESVLASMPGGTSSKMQIIRLRTEDGQKIVGSLIPGNCVKPLINILSQGSTKTYTCKHPVPIEEPDKLSMPVFV